MAKILCAYSSLELEISHFPLNLTSRECSHPIFCVSQKKLLGYAGKYASGELTSIDSYLLFLALLQSTDRVEFRVPAMRTINTDAIIANNMEALMQVVGKLNIITSPDFHIPYFVISQDTKNLENIANWIESWNECIIDFYDGYRSFSESRALLNRESALEKLIKNPQKSISQYASILAEWAAIAGEFPLFQTTLASGENIALATYWKNIIQKCCKEESIFSIPREDLEELITHCEDNIIHGSIFSHSLMSLLRGGREKQKNFLGLGDIDITSTSTYKIIASTDSVEQANIEAMIQAAPKEEPKECNYPSKIAYLRARAKYLMARDSGEPKL